ncbi:MAG: site-specific DNA-methyltransferase [Rikenellaceae bacterium]|nr:site-specific DNA-methyltransferase [Rikenellaceae bacterium]
MIDRITEQPFCQTRVSGSTFVNADCFDVFPFIEDKSIDAIICDLPYGTTQNKWDSVLPLDKLWNEYNRLLKENGVIVLFSSQPFTSALVMSNPKNYKHEWIWQKDKGSNFANTVREPMKEHENILVFANKKWTYNKQMEERKGSGSKSVGATNKHYKKSENYGLFQGAEFKVSELRVPSSIQFVKRQTGEHPTQKPLELLEYLVKTYTNEGDMILDNTMGSGTTNLAALKLNRKSIGIEKEKQYYDVAVRRLSEYCG